MSRWISRDLVLADNAVAVYLFVGNNALSALDPDGRAPIGLQSLPASDTGSSPLDYSVADEGARFRNMEEAMGLWLPDIADPARSQPQYEGKTVTVPDCSIVIYVGHGPGQRLREAQWAAGTMGSDASRALPYIIETPYHCSAGTAVGCGIGREGMLYFVGTRESAGNKLPGYRLASVNVSIPRSAPWFTYAGEIDKALQSARDHARTMCADSECCHCQAITITVEFSPGFKEEVDEVVEMGFSSMKAYINRSETVSCRTSQ